MVKPDRRLQERGVREDTNRLSTGVAGLDEILRGGLIPRRSYLVRGGPGSGKTILGLHFLNRALVENQRALLVRKIAKATLQHYGYKVLEAENGREGVELFRRYAGSIALVLLDMMMPVMGGEEALDEIRAIRRDIPVIGSSGYNETVAKQRFGGKGLAAFLQKPYSARVWPIA